MIQRLRVKNFALIEDIDIQFSKGLTVLTGETGTGKSIILEALNLLFGKRSNHNMIRYGLDEAIITGNFIINRNIQNKYNLPSNIQIDRNIHLNGKHKILLNNQKISLSYLTNIMKDVGNMHSQKDSNNLLDKNIYLELIDQMDEVETTRLKASFNVHRKEYQQILRDLYNLKEKNLEDKKQLDFITYQINEINSFNLTVDEKLNLEKEVNRLSNYNKISSDLIEIDKLINSQSFNINNLYDLSSKFSTLENIDDKYNEYSILMKDMYYNLEELNQFIKSEIYNLDYDSYKFDSMQKRLYDINKIEKKYNKDIKDLIEFKLSLEESVSLIENYDSNIIIYESELKKTYDQMFNMGIKLSSFRKKLALEFVSLLKMQIKELDLERSKIEISFNEIIKYKFEFNNMGLDEIDILISLNEGEPIRSLLSVASGGEMARIMFALKIVYAMKNNLSLLILDEIDIGISGKTAAMVADKMHDVSKNHQLIVISHLPQVAAKADNHYGIYKELRNGRMVTSIKKLSREERVYNIAMMLSDGSVSNYAVKQAANLLQK